MTKTKMNTYVKTGTFLTQAGNTRTMNFVDVVDMPRYYWSVSELEDNLNKPRRMVYDIDKQGWRYFNENTCENGTTIKRQLVEFNLRQTMLAFVESPECRELLENWLD
jgi:hypothetical protein